MASASKRIRLYWRRLGEHIHCRVFIITVYPVEGATGVIPGYSSALSGNIILRVDEWPTIRRQFEKIMEVLPEDLNN